MSSSLNQSRNVSPENGQRNAKWKKQRTVNFSFDDEMPNINDNKIYNRRLTIRNSKHLHNNS